MGSKLLVMAAILAGALALNAQTEPDELKPILAQEIEPGSVVAFQLNQYLAARIPKLPSPASAEQWTSEAKRWREHILNDIAFHGWPREWVDAAPSFEDLGVVETGQGYRWHKLRYEIVPGFDSTAILYEPEHIMGKAPAILNVNGHSQAGKALEYKQKRCINFAKRGIVALSLEWMGFGELYLPDMRTTSGHTWTWWVRTNWACFTWRCVEGWIISARSRRWTAPGSASRVSPGAAGKP